MTRADDLRVGVVGLGAMGGRLALHLHDAGRPVLAHDVDPQTRAALAGAGVDVRDSLEDLAVGCDVVVLSLPTPAVVLEVVTRIVAAAGPRPTLVLDTSTIDPGTAQQAASTLSAVGVAYADTPVLGRPASVGSWTFPVGGDPAAAATAAAVLDPVAARVVPVGEVGAASTLKLLNNLMLGTINAVTAELLAVAEVAGLDPGLFYDVVVDSGAASVSPMFRDVAGRAVDGDFTPVFPVRLMHKDNALALALAEGHDVPVHVGRAAQRLNTSALEAGLGDEDSIAVLKPLEAHTGRPARRHERRA